MVAQWGIFAHTYPIAEAINDKTASAMKQHNMGKKKFPIASMPLHFAKIISFFFDGVKMGGKCVQNAFFFAVLINN